MWTNIGLSICLLLAGRAEAKATIDAFKMSTRPGLAKIESRPSQNNRKIKSRQIQNES